MSAEEKETCAEMEALLAERASGPLEEAQASAVEAHLAGCAGCRASASEWEAVFSLVALPPSTLKEEAAFRGLGERTLAAWQRRERQWRRARGLFAAAAVLAAAAIPIWFWHVPASSSPALAVVQPNQPEWKGLSAADVEEAEATEMESASDDTPLLDGLALEGDGAFALGDSG